MTSNTRWLLETADVPIRYILAKRPEDATALPENREAAQWLAALAERSRTGHIGDIHGSHDYRMENILGKCWITGQSRAIEPFAEQADFITRYLGRHIETQPAESGFGRLYHYRDHEKILCCFLPFVGYAADPAVLHIARQRLDILYEFTRQKRYDIYVDGSKLGGVKKEWQPHVINPDLYAGGHIPLPDMHDLILFAGMSPHLTDAERDRAESVAGWLFGEGYAGIHRRYGYFWAAGGTYNAKVVIYRVNLPDFETCDRGDLVPALFTVFVLSHFRTASASAWFRSALTFLERYKNDAGRYRFPPYMITEKPDSHVISGGHMNAGEDRKSKIYGEIISTYWMERIYRNLMTLEDRGNGGP
ncbi:MAG: hypothetical protein PHZ09_06615 [Eubacteriales bacterium]|nr:hypothetical protein [Eubacteriales bacterium]